MSKEAKPKPSFTQLAIWVSVLIQAAMFASSLEKVVRHEKPFGGRTEPAMIPLTQLYRAVTSGDVTAIEVDQDHENGECRFNLRHRNGRISSAYAHEQSCGDAVSWVMERSAVPIQFLSAKQSEARRESGKSSLLIAGICLACTLWFALRKEGAGGTSWRQKLGLEPPPDTTVSVDPVGPSGEARVTFDDVAGIDEAENELRELVAYLKDPTRLKALGGLPPRGCLLIGPPGSGKTMLARAVAGEAGVPFFSRSGSSFSAKWLGESAKGIREFFAAARAQAPAIIFIDEIDAIGGDRDSDEFRRTGDLHALNELLTQMDGFNGYEGIVVIAATNRPDVLDPALTRRGRFDRKIEVSMPDGKGRKAILEATIRSRGVPLAEDVDLDGIARVTSGFSGAELANLVNEATHEAARASHARVEAIDFELARDRILMGSAVPRVLTPRELKTVAVHEAGHAIVAHFLPDCEPIHKVTIVNRGRALGMVAQAPETDRYLRTRTELVSMLALLLAGRLAERHAFPNEVTTGAADDLVRATDLAYEMVTKLGLAQGEGFSSLRVYPFTRSMSGSLIAAVEAQVETLLNEACDLAQRTLDEHRAHHDLLVTALLERETLTREDLDRLFAEPAEPAPTPSEA